MGIAADTASMPRGQVGALDGPKYVLEVVKHAADLFHCVDGPPRAYFEVPTGVVMLQGFTLPVGDPPQPIVARYRYVTVRPYVRIPRRVLEDHGSVAYADAAAFLVRHVCGIFDNARKAFQADDCPLLFWRRRPEIAVENSAETSALVMAMSMRVVIPGVDLVPHEFDYENPGKSELSWPGKV
jgi:hypothetical protein